MTLVNLSFVQCKGSGAIKADGMYVPELKDDQLFLNNNVRNRRTKCSIESKFSILEGKLGSDVVACSVYAWM